ncbi:hypothetical protein ACJJTC_002736 [Scirpophaga incertulas]
MNKNICRTCLTRNRRMIALQKIQFLLKQIKLIEIGTVGNICWECYNIMKKFSKFKLQILVAHNAFKCETNTQKSLSVLTVQSKCLYDYKFYHNYDPLTVPMDIKTMPLKEEDTNFNSIEISKNYTEEKIINVECTRHKSNYANNELGTTYTEPDIKLTGNRNWDDNELLHEFGCTVPILNDIKKSKLDNSEHSPSIYFLKTNNDTVDIGSETLKAFESNQESLPHEVILKNGVARKAYHSSITKAKDTRTLKKVKFKDMKNSKKDIMNKFVKINLTVEDMLMHREEKRSQPNFKKLPYKCDSCVLGFTRIEKFHSHMIKAHTENSGGYTCDVCNTQYPKKKRLERHCRKHFECYKCRLCKFETVELWSIYSHCQHKHCFDNVDSIHCPQCLSVFRTPEELSEHTRTKHILYCDERMHQVKRDFVCEICRKTFKTKSRLESHAATHSSALAQKLAFCTVCQIQYKNLHVYRNHIRNSAAHSRDTFPCPVCNKKFVSKVYWTSHYNFYHLNKFQYMCEICNKPFISDWRLKNHRQKHHGYSRTRDHTCNVCGKKFYTSSTLRAHQLIHSEQRSYMCEDCGDTFKQRAALYTHSRLVHKGVKRKKYAK